MKPRILMVAATPYFADRGSHIRIYSEMKYLRKDGYDIRLRAYDKQKQDILGASWKKVWLDMKLAVSVFLDIRRYRPDILHIHNYEGLLAAWVAQTAGRLCGRPPLPVIFDCQGSLAEEMYRYHLKGTIFAWTKPLFTLLEKALLAIPTRLIMSSENSFNALAKLGVQPQRMHVVRDGFDPELFPAEPQSAREKAALLRAELGISGNARVFLYSGSVSAAKGVDSLLDAIPALLDAIPDAVFLFAGSGDLIEPYAMRHAHLIAARKVIFTGRISYFDLPRYMALATYAIDPKRHTSESSGKIVNYIAAGKPVLCFECPDAALRPYVCFMRSLSDLGAAAELSRPIPCPGAAERDRLSWSSIAKDIAREYDALGVRRPMDRTDILNALIQARSYRSYLEIGVRRTGDNFDMVRAERKVGVDPDARVTGIDMHMDSDAFFARCDESFDIIFLDGYHTEEQTDRDIRNALSHLSPGGAIVIHDCLPSSKRRASPRPPLLPWMPWNGEAWKSMRTAIRSLPYDAYVVDCDQGCGIIDTRSDRSSRPPEGAISAAEFLVRAF
jgi:glycosyltransferase involved in cell wall biosynthesis